MLRAIRRWPDRWTSQTSTACRREKVLVSQRHDIASMGMVQPQQVGFFALTLININTSAAQRDVYCLHDGQSRLAKDAWQSAAPCDYGVR